MNVKFNALLRTCTRVSLGIGDSKSTFRSSFECNSLDACFRDFVLSLFELAVNTADTKNSDSITARIIILVCKKH